MSLRAVGLALVVVLLTSISSAAWSAVPVAQDASAQSDAAAKAKKDYDDTVHHGDEMMTAANYFEAVLAYERAKRVAYSNKLQTDSAALEEKLNAARKARDTKPATPAPPAPATAAQQRVEQSPASTPTASALADYNEAVRYGDALSAAGEFFDAVTQYERAGRIRYSNKLNTDNVALETKLALARKSRDAKAVAPGELLPPPPPPVAGFETDFVRFMPDQPGKFRPWRFVAGSDALRDYGLTAPEAKTLEANVLRLVDVVKKVPLLNPPTGFEFEINGWIGGPAFLVDGQKHRQLPLSAVVSYGGYGYFEEKVRLKSTGQVVTRPITGDETNSSHLVVNEIPQFDGWDDAEGRFFLEPKKQGEIGGYPVYEGDLLILRPGDKPYVPVTMERFLKAWLLEMKRWADAAERGLADRRKAAEKDVTPDRLEQWRKEETAARAKGGTGAEQEARRLETIHRRWEDDARKVLAAADKDPKYVATMNAYKDAQVRQASLDAQSRSAAVCLQNTGAAFRDEWKFAPKGATDCRRVVQPNFAIFNRLLPRTALQIVYAERITECVDILQRSTASRENPGSCLAVVKILRQLDWRQVAGLLQK